MASGAVEDEVAAHLNVGKTTLRRKHIFALRAGRKTRRQEVRAVESEKLSVAEQEMRAAFFSGYGTHWEDSKYGNLLQDGRTREESEAAFSAWLAQHRNRGMTDV